MGMENSSDRREEGNYSMQEKKNVTDYVTAHNGRFVRHAGSADDASSLAAALIMTSWTVEIELFIILSGSENSSLSKPFFRESFN